MKTEIFNTRKKAEMAAKREVSESLGLKSIYSVYSFFAKQSATQCDCGETTCIEVTGFRGKDLHKQHTARAGYCPTCGRI